MRNLLLTLAALAAFLVGSGAAHAQGVYRYFNSAHPYIHDRYHQEAINAALARQQVVQNAHLYPITWWQHQQTMDYARRDALDGWLEIRQIERQYDYLWPYRTGFLYPGYYYRPATAVVVAPAAAITPTGTVVPTPAAGVIVPAAYTETPSEGITITTPYYKGK